jgi:hypothetical protein
MKQPELTVSRAAHGLSDEAAPDAAETIADLRTQLAAERIQRLEAEHRLERAVFRANADVERAEADAAVLRDAIQRTLAECPFCQVGRCRSEAHQWLRTAAAEHPGDALLAELAAAREIVEEARPSNCFCTLCTRLRALYAAYDAAVEARKR